jgi:hypothetical protein
MDEARSKRRETTPSPSNSDWESRVRDKSSWKFCFRRQVIEWPPPHKGCDRAQRVEGEYRSGSSNHQRLPCRFALTHCRWIKPYLVASIEFLEWTQRIGCGTRNPWRSATIATPDKSSAMSFDARVGIRRSSCATPVRSRYVQ